MFIDASVRNESDTLKTSLKFFVFKIYTWVRLLLFSFFFFISVKFHWSTSSTRLDVTWCQSSESELLPESTARAQSSMVQSSLRCKTVVPPPKKKIFKKMVAFHPATFQTYSGPWSRSLSLSLSFLFPLSSVLFSFILFYSNNFNGINIWTSLYKWSILTWAWNKKS